METRSGGKFGKSHSTLTEAGAIIADIAAKCPDVKRVIHGYIKISRRTSGSIRRVTLTIDGYAIEVKVIAGGSMQILFVYATDNTVAMDQIERAAEKNNFNVVRQSPRT